MVSDIGIFPIVGGSAWPLQDFQISPISLRNPADFVKADTAPD
jgi:hypothetical protein